VRRRVRIDAVAGVDYRRSFVMPIRDMWTDDARIVLKVIVYGWDPEDACVIPGGADPFLHAVRRLGLNPARYQAVIWDVPVRSRRGR